MSLAGNPQVDAWNIGHDVTIKGLDTVRLQLQSMLPEVRAAIEQVVTQDAIKMRDLARRLASGAVIQSRTGRFVASIKEEVTSTATSVVGKVYSDDPRDPLFEYGGTQAPREILPNAAQALAFMGSAGRVFAAAVHRPAVTYPERPIIHAAFDQMRAGETETLGWDSTLQHRGLAGDIEAAAHKIIIDKGWG